MVLLFDDELDDEDVLLPDGGDEQYYWKGPEGILYHTESGKPNVADPFAPSIEEAERILEGLAESNGWENYSDMALYKAKQNGHYRVMESTEVRTEQQGITDF